MPRLARFAALFALAAAPAWAQGVLTFESDTHGFGKVEEGEKPTHVFRFTNTGDQPVTLTRVRPACGCTTPAFTVAPVAPGEEGIIEVTYDSKGRPGPFNKTIAVTAEGAEPAAYTLRIVGDVVRASLDKERGVTQGNVLFESDSHAATAAGGDVSHTYTLQNTGTRPLKFTGAHSMPGGAVVVLPQRPVFAGELAEITVTLPAEMVGTAGADVAVVVETDDAAQPAKSLRLVARPAAASGTSASAQQ